MDGVTKTALMMASLLWEVDVISVVIFVTRVFGTYMARASLSASSMIASREGSSSFSFEIALKIGVSERLSDAGFFVAMAMRSAMRFCSETYRLVPKGAFMVALIFTTDSFLFSPEIVNSESFAVLSIFFISLTSNLYTLFSPCCRLMLSLTTTTSGIAMIIIMNKLIRRLMVTLSFCSSVRSLAMPTMVSSMMLTKMMAKRFAPKRSSAPLNAVKSLSAILMPAAASGGIKAAATATPAR